MQKASCQTTLLNQKSNPFSTDEVVKIKNVVMQSITESQDKAAKCFKTGKGDYAEGDVFIGVTVPDLRKISKNFLGLGFKDLRIILSSKINEERFLALVILVEQFKKFPEKRKEIYNLYLENTVHINNWNLVDCSAHYIVGAYLFEKKREILLKLSRSENMWERRIAVVSTWYFIRKQDLDWTFKIIEELLNDNHDLIHKASGWMLREVGKRDIGRLLNFLDKHARCMPRTMLRYAIEKLKPMQRKNYLTAKIKESKS